MKADLSHRPVSHYDGRDSDDWVNVPEAEYKALLRLADQYLADMRFPPSADSRERRVEAIVAVLDKGDYTLI